jgi:hypothetical protein
MAWTWEEATTFLFIYFESLRGDYIEIIFKILVLKKGVLKTCKLVISSYELWLKTF